MIARLLPDGSLDEDFNVWEIEGFVYTIALQSDGKILIGGDFTSIWGEEHNYIARLLPDGSLDTSFSTNPDASILTIAVQHNGRILIWWAFSSIWYESRPYFARLREEDGSLDYDFDANVNNIVNTIAIQNSGEIFIWGEFSTVWGESRTGIAKVLPDGTLDEDFEDTALEGLFKSIGWWIGGWIIIRQDPYITTITIQDDGMILIWGEFSSVRGEGRNNIARLLPDGSLDEDFNTEVDGLVQNIYLLSNGDIIIGWSFSNVWGYPRTSLAKLFTSGDIDPDFDMNIQRLVRNFLIGWWWLLVEEIPYIYAITIDFYGNLIIGGDFTSINDNTNNAYLAWIGLNTTVNNRSLWLKADAGTNCNTDGCPISLWQDKSSYHNDASQSDTDTQPFYKENIVNGHPVINFQEDTQFLTSSLSSDYKTVFAVRNLAEAGSQYLFGTDNNDIAIRSSSTFDGDSDLTYTEWPDSNDRSYNGSLSVNGQETNVAMQQYHIVKSVSEDPITDYYTISDMYNRGMYGDDGIAELMAYTTDLDEDTTNKIESYLAIKYGITLDQSTHHFHHAHNYVLSNNTLSWSVVDAWIYNLDIAGIVRDNGMGLLQTRSQSINDSNDIIIQANDTLPNMTSLTWSHNDASDDLWYTDNLPWGISSRTERTRYIQEKHGDVGEVTITYPPGWLPLDPYQQPALMIDDDGDFTNGGTTIIPGIVNDDNQRIFTNNLEDNTYITFGLWEGDICIEWPYYFDFWSYTIQNTSQTIVLTSDSFIVDDQRWSGNGYYTTLSISDLVGIWDHIISSSSAISIKSYKSVQTLAGYENPIVVFDDALSDYIPADTPVTFIKRDLREIWDGWIIGPWWIRGTYGGKIQMRIILPAYQAIDTYTGMITYTLYEN